jgi:hypothetical protein
MAGGSYFMELQSLLEFIRLQRHDFLNHLQVISGFIQMNKGEQAREYLLGVARELERLGRVIHLQMPEATAAFLAALARGNRLQVEVDYDIRCHLGGCAVSGARVGRALETAFQRVLSFLSPPEVRMRRMEIILQESGECYTCQLVFPSGDFPGVEEELQPLKDILSGQDGRVEMGEIWRDNGKFFEVLLFFPRREP